jgi:hypothetical protein
MEHDLARTVTDGPPWETVADTTLAPGEEVHVTYELALDPDLDGGIWNLIVEVVPTARGQLVPDAPSYARRLLPLRVE